MTIHEQELDIKEFAENQMKPYCERFTWNDAKEIISVNAKNLFKKIVL